MMVLLVVAALGVGYGLGALSRGESGGAAGRVERGDAPPVDTGKIVGRVVDESGDGMAGVAL
jgi:hypothetical protein